MHKSKQLPCSFRKRCVQLCGSLLRAAGHSMWALPEESPHSTQPPHWGPSRHSNQSDEEGVTKGIHDTRSAEREVVRKGSRAWHCYCPPGKNATGRALLKPKGPASGGHLVRDVAQGERTKPLLEHGTEVVGDVHPQHLSPCPLTCLLLAEQTGSKKAGQGTQSPESNVPISAGLHQGINSNFRGALIFHLNEMFLLPGIFVPRT